MRRATNALDLWRLGMTAGVMAAQAQLVVGLRVMGMAGLRPQAPAETTRMITEKTAAAGIAFAAAQRAALSGRRADEIAAAALRPYARATRNNSRRLSRRPD